MNGCPACRAALRDAALADLQSRAGAGAGQDFVAAMQVGYLSKRHQHITARDASRAKKQEVL